MEHSKELYLQLTGNFNNNSKIKEKKENIMKKLSRIKGAVLLSLVTLLSLGTLPADAADVVAGLPQVDLLKVEWQTQRVSATLAAPDEAKWQKVAPWNGGWRQAQGKTRRSEWEEGGTWKQVTLDAPAEWKDAFVRLEFETLVLCDAVIFVNGEKVGEVLRPGGFIDLSRFVKPGEKNVLRFYYTITGEGTTHGKWTIGSMWQHFMGPGSLTVPKIVASKGPQVTDVFAKTSAKDWRIDFEIEVTCRDDAKAQAGVPLSVIVRDEASNVVKRLSEKVALKGGINSFSLGEAWKNPVCWELGDPYLYTAEVKVGDFAEKTVRFGFREIWRDGKDLMMNGHKVRLRTCFDYVTNAKGLDFLHDIGYNVVTANHRMDSIVVQDERHLNDMDERGIGYFCSPGDMCNIAGVDFANDEAAANQLRHFWKWNLRKLRNHPSLLACYITQMIICNIGWGPEGIGQGVGKGARDVAINKGREIAREIDPNILYYSHADGPNGDISSGNIYLNWTPLQERTEWLAQWKEKGTYPWHGAEVGQPYMGCWFDREHMYVGTEHLAQYFGDAVYTAEDEKWLRTNLVAGASMRSEHGSGAGFAAVSQHPYFKELERAFIWNSNSRWRADGQNGGNLWFNRHGYGSDQGDAYLTDKSYRLELKDYEKGVRPAWANASYDNYQLGNQDFCGYIGGAPDHYDRTHAYYAGETIAKQAVFCWDGRGKEAFTATATFNGETKTVTAKVVTGETEFRPFSFKAPKVAKKTAFDLTLTFKQGEKTWFTDTLKIEVYPKARIAPIATKKRVALFDPKGTSEGILKTLGVKYRKISSLEELDRAEALVVGRFAASEMPLDSLAKKVEKGFKVLILAQDADTWLAFGIRPMDAGSRLLWLRDKKNPLFADVTDDTLAYWRGAPDYGDAGFGPLMNHTKSRGPRWTRRHMVAGLVLEIPSAVGYRSVIDGEFDMNYAGVLEFLSGKGKVTYCSLDLEGRVGVDPAATIVARAVVANALQGSDVAASSETLYVSADSKVTWAELKAKAENGTRILVEANARLAAEAGLTVGAKEKIWRAPLPADDAAFRCIGPSLSRWSDYIETQLVDGAIAKTVRVGSGEIVFLMVPRGEFATRYLGDVDVTGLKEQDANRKKEERRASQRIALYAEEHVDRLYERVMTNLGFAPGERGTRRALYQQGVAALKPLPAVYALGPFATGKDNDDEIDKVWCEEGEKMAIAGDFNPNINFPLPQGGTANWRTRLAPDANGCYDFRKLGGAWETASSPSALAIATITRKEAGEVLMKIGMDWRLRMWVNGEEVFKSGFGAHYPKFDVKVNLKKGKNVIAFKIGAGRTGFALHALIEGEVKGGTKRVIDPTLDELKLYPDRISFDPYEFSFW